MGNRKRDIAKGAAVAAAKGTKIVVKELTTKREDGVLPKAASDSLERIESLGEDAVERMVVVRTPVQAYVGKLMQVVSLGRYREVLSESSYDRMFHLSLLINGRHVLQKNEVIVLSDAGGAAGALQKGSAGGSEVMAVRLPPPGAEPPLTLRLLLDRTLDRMGPRAFSNYCAVTNNCQDFILAVLEGNGLANPPLVSFVKQDSEAIFNKLPIHTKPVALALTNMAAVGDKVKEDAVVKHQETDYAELLGKAGSLVLAAVGDKRKEDAVAKHPKTDHGELAATVGEGGKAVLGLAGSLLQSGAARRTGKDSEATLDRPPVRAEPAAPTNAAAGEKEEEDAVANHPKTGYGKLAASVGEGGKAVLGLAGSFVRGGMAKRTGKDSAKK